MMVTEYAPCGVIGAITPTTNPTSTVINNSIAIISAGNAVTFNVHPNARRVSVENVQLLNRAIVGADVPQAYMPSRGLRLWSLASLVILALASVTYLYVRFVHG